MSTRPFYSGDSLRLLLAAAVFIALVFGVVFATRGLPVWLGTVSSKGRATTDGRLPCV